MTKAAAVIVDLPRASKYTPEERARIMAQARATLKAEPQQPQPAPAPQPVHLEIETRTQRWARETAEHEAAVRAENERRAREQRRKQRQAQQDATSWVDWTAAEIARRIADYDRDLAG